MEPKPITLIVGDLHMGDGQTGDDFVGGKQFVQFLSKEAASPGGLDGKFELIINGDFLEFVQVYPQGYGLDPPDFWCTEEESVAKLEYMLRGHADVFTALKDFQRTGNRVTLFAGNHDVDLYWPAVRARIRECAGEVNFELGDVWYQRYRGRLRISHGHLFTSIDPANNFKAWKDPCLPQPNDALPRRLEMCPGTLFVVRFVNLLEAKYPFADNLHPELALANILWRENRWGLKVVGWMLAKFAAKFPNVILSSDAAAVKDVGKLLLDAVKVNPRLQEDIASLYREVLGESGMTADQVPDRLSSENAIAAFVERLLQSNVDWNKWLAVLDRAKPAVLGTSGGTLQIGKAAQIDVKQKCIEVARNAWRDGAQVVVFGHTHLPQDYEEGDGTQHYYNPGSWTRYVDAAKTGTLTLKDLEREDRFPFELNCVRIEDTGSDMLKSELICIDKRVFER